MKDRDKLSIIFFGTPEFAVPSLLALLRSGEKISLVVTQPDKLKGRGHKLGTPPVKIAAMESGLNVKQPATIRDNAFLSELTALKPDLLIVVAYGKLLPKALLEIPRLGPVNVHASLLPKYRGAAPIQWAIINGEKKTGVTTMIITEKLDTGPILLQKETEIKDEDTQESLGKRLSEIGAELLLETIKGMRNGRLNPVPQTDGANYAPPLKKTDGLINWSRNSDEIFNFIRGMYPWPGAYCHIDNETVKILKVSICNEAGTPGIIVKLTGNDLIVGTGRGLISIKELQPAGGKAMSAAAFIQGRKLKEGILIQ